MKVKKAVITAAGPDQRKLPIQTLIDSDGNEKSVLEILIEEVIQAGVDEVCVVVHPGDEKNYQQVIGQHSDHVTFIHQKKAMGYGHALLSAEVFTDKDHFLHLVGDHLYVHRSESRCAKHLVETAEKQECSVSAVQATRESHIPHYGVVGGSRVQGSSDLYQVDKVIEKPTPTEAEQKLLVPGLRAGHYLCFFGMHVLSPAVMKILGEKLKNKPDSKLNLSDALNELCEREQYLALEKTDLRFDMGAKYGLLKAQLALALNGKDRDRIMGELLEFFGMKELNSSDR
ncbi:sugar phosphate nucleotidyltransferase [Bacteroidota bacterium]